MKGYLKSIKIRDMGMLAIILVICLSVTGCGYDKVKEQRVKKDLAKQAQSYVTEKYGMTDAKVGEVKLSYGGYNGPIPQFKREVPKSGVVTLEYKGVSFRVLAGPVWNRFTDEFKNVLSDDYQAEQIKADIREQLIDKYKVTGEYNLYNYRVSSEQDHGELDYFTLEQKYDGILETFLKNNKLGLELEIFFKGNEADQADYFDKTNELFNQLASRFGNAESSISLYVGKEDRYMDERMKDILDPQNPKAIDPIIYGPAYNYCRVTGETHNTEYIARIKKEYPESDMAPLEVKANRFSYVDLDEGISLASMVDNVDFLTKEDIVSSIRPLAEGDLFDGADFNALLPTREQSEEFEYKLLNEKVYSAGFRDIDYSDNRINWRDSMALKIKRSQVPESADRLFLVYQSISGPNSGDLSILDLSEPYFLASGDSWIAPARPNGEFMIVYREKK